MMENYYTTGRLAELCGVTKRTVQYYDLENIVKPSQISEGGRRLYTDEDLKKFKLVCLYRKLELPLKEIKIILNSDDQYKMLRNILAEHQSSIDNQIKNLTELKERLSAALEEITVNKTISLANEEELEQLIIRKKHHKKIERITYLLLIFYVIILFLSCIVGALSGGILMYLIIGFNVLLLCALIFFHSAQNAYVCPNCNKKFTISFFRDIVTLNNGKKGKYLECPYCHQKNWLAETFKDE